MTDRKEYMKEYHKAYYEKHKEEMKVAMKTYYSEHKAELNVVKRAYYQEHKKERNIAMKKYLASDVNSLGQTKASIRAKSNYYLRKNGQKIDNFEIHRVCSYNEPYKFIYCSKEIHRLIHAYLRENNIDADTEHYEHIKHLLDDTVVLYGID